jgi:hypothetical protein
MVGATYFQNDTGAASRYLRPALFGRTAFSYHPNGSTHGPPTSSAVQVNLGISGAVSDRVRANRVRAATASGYVGHVYGANCAFGPVDLALSDSKQLTSHQSRARQPRWPVPRNGAGAASRSPQSRLAGAGASPRIFTGTFQLPLTEGSLARSGTRAGAPAPSRAATDALSGRRNFFHF